MNERDSILPAILEEVRGESLLKQARIVRNWREGPERAEQAKRLIRQALVEWAMGNLSQEIESQLYFVLGFAMREEECDTPDDLAAAYQQQINRQGCTECGEGRCPVPDDE